MARRLTRSVLRLILVCIGYGYSAQARNIRVIVTDTFGHPVRQYRVEYKSLTNSSAGVWETPRSVSLPDGKVWLRVSASLHRSEEQVIEVTPLTNVMMLSLVRPSGYEITGEGSPANPTCRVSLGGVSTSGTWILRVVGVYSPLRRDILITDPGGTVSIEDLPYGTYRLLLFLNGAAVRDFELVNEEFKSSSVHELFRSN